MAIYDISGNIISSNNGSDVVLAPKNFDGIVENVFDISQNTEENAYTEHEIAYHHPSLRSWVGVGSYKGRHFSYLIPVKPNEKYYLQNICLTAESQASAIFYTESKEPTTQSGTLSAVGNYITIPATAYYMRVSVHADTVDTVMVLKGTEKPIDVFVPFGRYVQPELYGNIGKKSIDYQMLRLNTRPHRFYGMKVGCLGDSLTAMGARWQKRLMLSMGFASITNYGVSGTTVTSWNPENTYRDRVESMAEDLDLIIVMTSPNDNNAPIGKYNSQQGTGTLEDATNLNENDVSTIAGAGVELLNLLKAKYPHKDIVFFGHPHTYLMKWDEPDMYKLVCGRRSVPFFDMMRCGGMDTKGGDASEESAYYFTDLIHLTDAGNDRVADYMAGCLRTL